MRSKLFSGLMALAGLTLMLSGGAIADDQSDCESEDMGARLVACTRLIETGKLLPKDLSNSYNNRGMAHVILGSLDRAARDFDKALTLDPTSAVAYLNRGYTNAFSEKFDASERDFASAMKAKPDWAEPYVGRSLTRFMRGSLDGAVVDLTTAIKIDPDNAQNYVSRGGVYRQQGKVAEAISDFKAALKINPQVDFAREHLEELLGDPNAQQNCPNGSLSNTANFVPVLRRQPGRNAVAWKWRQRKTPGRRYACLDK